LREHPRPARQSIGQAPVGRTPTSFRSGPSICDDAPGESMVPLKPVDGISMCFGFWRRDSNRLLSVLVFVLAAWTGTTSAAIKVIDAHASYPEGPVWQNDKLLYVEYGGPGARARSTSRGYSTPGRFPIPGSSTAGHRMHRLPRTRSAPTRAPTPAGPVSAGWPRKTE
jgi:hypothetical protein